MSTAEEQRTRVTVIGAGPAGVHCAGSLASKGFDVTIIDREIGGNYCRAGSVISNALLYLTRLYSRFSDKGKNFTKHEGDAEFSFDLKKASKYIEQVVTKLRKTFAEDLEEKSIKFLYGSARFSGKNSITVTTVEGEIEHEFDYCVIATGSCERDPGFTSSKKFMTIQSFLENGVIPSSVTVVGGGFVGCEFATIFRRIGCEVNIIECRENILNEMDTQIAKKFEEKLKKCRINVVKQTRIVNVEKVGNKSIIFLENGQKLESEEIFTAVGRKPCLDGLNINTAGIKLLEDGSVKLTKKLKTTAKNIYVVGDAAADEMLVNWAYRSADIVSEEIAGTGARVSVSDMPKVLYLDPEISRIGITEEQAKEKGIDYSVIKYNYSDLEKSLIQGAQKGYMKVVYDKKTRKIHGCHVIGEGASHIATMFSIIMQSGITIDKISTYVFNHPTYAEVLSDIASKVK
ncbi:dihydrolipoyl dehydrogenase family protein [Limisalsivibrio acetivorans]|uniref:dihydrolipoyl dehydrogenase family protein n=1 Tax=Limisalsivibrio acetivorans TaxID=1304888 RepID=UPI0003B36859|nr:NAD(P)/FAD-dependent oxidoreductase [Limisalsivibrio acetivorans]